MKNILILKTGEKPARESRLQLALQKISEDVSYQVRNYNEVAIKLLPNVCSVSVGGQDILSFDLVYIRSWEKKQPLATSIAKFLQHHQRKFLETAVSLPTSGDKLLQMMLLQLNGLPIPPTLYFSRETISANSEYIVSQLGLPLIMKATSASKGDNNYLVQNQVEIDSYLLKVPEAIEILFQKFLPNKYDYRLLVLGSDVHVAEKRIRTSDTTHLNNAAQGAVEEFLDPRETSDLNAIAVRAAALFSRQIAGVDIVISSLDGRAYILEVNPSPGFTYECSSPEVGKLNDYLVSLL